MEANEFVKKFGLDSFKAAILCTQFKRYSYAILYFDEVDFSNDFIDKHADYMFKTSEIKRLVDSHEFVGNFGGIEAARFYLKSKYREVSTPKTHAMLKQAIADVESCQ